MKHIRDGHKERGAGMGFNKGEETNKREGLAWITKDDVLRPKLYNNTVIYTKRIPF